MLPQRFDQYIINQSPLDLNYGELLITNESRYSSLMPWHIDQVSQIVLQETYGLNINQIVDNNAHIGVDSILFRLLFPDANILSIELNPQTFNLLQQNVNHLNQIINQQHVKPIDVVNDDCLNYVGFKTDIQFYDPPWGIDYQKYNKMNLYLSNIDLGYIVNNVLRVNPCLIILKLPFNIDMQSLWNKIIYNIPYQLYFNSYNIYTQSGKLSYILAFIKPM
jgi:hypothetical protein